MINLFYGFIPGLASGLMIGLYFVQKQKKIFDEIYTIHKETLGPLKNELADIKAKLAHYESQLAIANNPNADSSVFCGGVL